MTDTPTGPTLAQALVEAQAKMPAVSKDGKNPHFNSKFVTLDALIDATRPILNAHGLAITQKPTANPEGLPMLQTTLVFGPTGEQVQFDTPLFLSRSDMQGYGAAITYARRYAWAAVLGIASEEDTDGGPPVQPEAKAQPAAKAKTGPSQKAIGFMGALVKELQDNDTPIPKDYAGAENWVDVLRLRVQGFGVESRKDLTPKQASELIDWLEAQKIPF